MSIFVQTSDDNGEFENIVMQREGLYEPILAGDVGYTGGTTVRRHPGWRSLIGC